MRYRLRTLLIVVAVVPPVASLASWLFERELLPFDSIVLPIALAVVLIYWLRDLADYLSRHPS
jgi:hypothetical protein